MDTRERTLAAQQRALAREELNDPAARASVMSEYRLARARATLVVLDWVEGVSPFSPATARELVADEASMDRERSRAHDLEADALGTPVGWYFGVVEQMLACLLGRAGAMPPYVG